MLCSTYIHTYIVCIYTQTYVVHTTYTLLSRNWKYMSHFHVRSSQNTPNEDGYATWTIYDQFRLNIHFHAIIKVIVYKSCGELSRTISTFGPAQRYNFKKLKSSFYDTKLEIVTTQSAQTDPNLQFFFIKRTHRMTLLEGVWQYL